MVKTKTRIAIAVSLVSLGVILVLVCLLLGTSSHRTKDLRMGEVEVEEDTYYAQFFEGGETTKAASVYVRVSAPGAEGYRRMLVQICHEENTELDTLSLTFNAVRPADALAYLAPNSASWPPVEYRTSSNGGGVEYVVSKFGIMGVGTVNMEYMLDSDALNSSLSDGLRLSVEFTMHKNAWGGCAKQRCQGTICLEDLGVPQKA